MRYTVSTYFALLTVTVIGALAASVIIHISSINIVTADAQSQNDALQALQQEFRLHGMHTSRAGDTVK